MRARAGVRANTLQVPALPANARLPRPSSMCRSAPGDSMAFPPVRDAPLSRQSPEMRAHRTTQSAAGPISRGGAHTTRQMGEGPRTGGGSHGGMGKKGCRRRRGRARRGPLDEWMSERASSRQSEARNGSARIPSYFEVQTPGTAPRPRSLGYVGSAGPRRTGRDKRREWEMGYRAIPTRRRRSSWANAARTGWGIARRGMPSFAQQPMSRGHSWGDAGRSALAPRGHPRSRCQGCAIRITGDHAHEHELRTHSHRLGRSEGGGGAKR